MGVVTYIAVIDVDAASQDIPPGSTAIVTLAGSERTQAVRIPNNAFTFAPPAASFAAVDQEPPVLSRPDSDSRKQPEHAEGYVWKFENNRFVPIPVKRGSRTIRGPNWCPATFGLEIVWSRLPLRRRAAGRGEWRLPIECRWRAL